MMDNYATLTQKLIEHKNNKDIGIYFINGEKEEKFLSYADLYNNAVHILYNLQCKGVKAGDELIFQIKDEYNYTFLQIFWACLLGKIVPVPLAASSNDNGLKLFYVLKILKNPKVILDMKTFEGIKKFAVKNYLENEFEYISNNSFLIDEVTKKNDKGIIENCKTDDVAFIQFTSGTTDKSKGVVLTHKNLITNINGIISSACMSEKDIMLSWMPLIHDMGMIGFHLVPLYKNMNQYNIPTASFVRNPTLWMKKVNEHRATLLGASNFGLRYFLDHIKGKEFTEWDLSCIRKVFNGAEAISISLIDDFVDKLNLYGLKKLSMYPVYGMAEASLAVTFPLPDEEYSYVNVKRESLGIGNEVIELSDTNSPSSIKLVEEGYPLNGCSIKIVDDFGNELNEKKVGHIQISGDNVTKQYYENAELTREITARNGWLDTGDLGFIIRGKLVVTGRYEDLINIGKQSYYPHDLENICETIDDISNGKVVVCGAYDRMSLNQKLIVFVWYKKKIEDFMSISIKVKEVLKERIGICVDHVIPVKSIPKTTSGKIQRYILIEQYNEGEYEEVIKVIEENSLELTKIS